MSAPPRAVFAGRLARNALLWIVPAALTWVVLSPLYNRALVRTTEQLLHLTESPNATRLYVRDGHILFITRLDVGGGQTALEEYELSDAHFNWILLAALFLATPGVPWKERARGFAWSAAVLVGFHLLLEVFVVKSTYAGGLGDWSARHYGAWGRNFWGLGRHLLDLPLKLGLPFVLWAAFFFARLGGDPATRRA